jgi:hypothetical protein
MNNIIDFAKFKNSLDSLEDTEEDTEEVIPSDMLVERIWANALQELERSGCKLSKDTRLYFPAMVLVLESIRSLHMLSNGKEHALQDFAREALDNYDLEHLFDEIPVDIDKDMD